MFSKREREMKQQLRRADIRQRKKGLKAGAWKRFPCHDLYTKCAWKKDEWIRMWENTMNDIKKMNQNRHSIEILYNERVQRMKMNKTNPKEFIAYVSKIRHVTEPFHYFYLPLLLIFISLTKAIVICDFYSNLHRYFFFRWFLLLIIYD